MKGTGYEKFFKEASKASGLTAGQGEGRSSAQKTSGSSSQKIAHRASVPSGDKMSFKSRSKSTGKPQFRIDSGSSANKRTPEEHLRRELAERLKKKKHALLQKRRRFPMLPVACTTVALFVCAIGYWNPDVIDELLQELPFKVSIGAIGSANAAETSAPAKTQDAAKKTESNAESKEKAAAPKAQSESREVPNVKQWSAEELSFFSKLNDRKKELDLREAELAKLEEELQKRKAELDERLQSLEAMRADISKALQTRVATDQQKVDKLVDFYSSMKPQQAAKVIETINEDLAVEVLDKMKKKNAAEIFNALDAKKARRLSELLTGYQRTPAAASAAPVQAADEQTTESN